MILLKNREESIIQKKQLAIKQKSFQGKQQPLVLIQNQKKKFIIINSEVKMVSTDVNALTGRAVISQHEDRFEANLCHNYQTVKTP